jgi:hypothetical protein
LYDALKIYIITIHKSKKTIMNFLKILGFVTVLLMYTGISVAQKKVAIILQENSGATILDNVLPAQIIPSVQGIIDGLAESFETKKTSLLAAARYDKVINLSDARCTRANLLISLISESVAGNIIDLYVYGHGSTNSLMLYNGQVLNGAGIRSLLTDAQQQRGASFNFKLRLVYMCNCLGSTCNEDWVSIGAKASVGSKYLNFMPEPQITFFINDFVNNNLPVSIAAMNAWSLSRPFWTLAPTYQDRNPEYGNLNKIDQSQPIVAGNQPNLRHTDIRLSVGETRTFNVIAKTVYNFPDIYVYAGEKYSFSATGTWVNCNGCITGSTSTSAQGYTATLADAAKRRGEYNMMALVGELYDKNNDGLSFNGTHFLVGKSATYSPTKNGYFGFFANDGLTFYGDNSGSVTVTVTRNK